MKKPTTPRRRATWLLLATSALFATPALAQDAAVAPPPVIQTVPQTAAPDPAPTARQAPPAAGESKTVIRPEAREVVDEARQAPAARPAAQPARRMTRTTTTTTTTRPTAAAPAPAPVTVPPVPAPIPSPEAALPQPIPATEPVAPDVTATDVPATVETNQTTESTPAWPWIALGAVLILAGLGLFAFRRKRASAVYDERYAQDAYYTEATPVAVEPTPVAAYEPEPTVDRSTVPAAVAAVPAAVAASELQPAAEIDPVTPEDVSVSEAEAGEVAALTDAAAPVTDRPWLEFAMRPVRAGTNTDEAMVEIELTVANSGSLPAQDVRVSTFMLADANSGEMERLLIDPPADAAVQPITILPGEGARIEATLATLKADLGGAGVGFTPVVVADARYRLPDGTEGRTSASFMVGMTDENGNITPFHLDDREMHEDVEARLHGKPQRV